MANWSNPTVTSTYTNFVTEVKDRDTDLALGLDPANTSPTNVPTNAIRWNSANNCWEKYNGSTWVVLSSTYALTALTTTGNVSAGGVLLVPAGTAAAPSLTITNDTNTGIYSPGADQIALVTGGTGRVFVDASGNVGIGTSGPSHKLQVFGTSDAVADFTGSGVAGLQRLLQLRTSTGNTYGFQIKGDYSTEGYLIQNYYNSYLAIGTYNTERLRIDTSGRLLVGTSSARAVNAQTAQYQVEGTSIATSSASFVQNSNDANGPRLTFGKTRGTAVSDATVVISGDNLGSLVFAGANGTDLSNAGASIVAQVDGEPLTAGDTTDMPGRLIFSTTADGASSPTERMRITNDGVSCYNQAAPAAVNTTATLTIANLKTRIITSTTAAAVTMTLPTGTDAEAGFASIYTNMSFEWYVINTGATNAVTVAANTGHTIVGSGTVAASTSGCFMSRRTASNTFVTYRLS